jgi:hypothetical protein
MRCQCRSGHYLGERGTDSRAIHRLPRGDIRQVVSTPKARAAGSKVYAASSRLALVSSEHEPHVLEGCAEQLHA